MVTSQALGQGHKGQLGSADLQEAMGGCSPDPGSDHPAPAKGNGFADAVCPWLDAAQKEITFTGLPVTERLFSGLLILFTCSISVFSPLFSL